MLNAAQTALVHAAGLKEADIRPLHGGDIADVVQMGQWVLKTSRTQTTSNQFLIEAEGLRALSERGCPTPTVKHVNAYGMVMPFYSAGAATSQAYANLGVHLANLHLNKAPYQSASKTLYLGALKLDMGPKDLPWHIEFVHHRLHPLLTRARAQGHRLSWLDLGWLAEQDFPNEGRCLIHGDLWSGNLLNSDAGIRLIDPSCWYAERGLDIAMLTLFGNPPPVFWKTYEAIYPIPDVVRQFIPVYQLYYALAHVCLFGNAYNALCRNLWTQFKD